MAPIVKGACALVLACLLSRATAKRLLTDDEVYVEPVNYEVELNGYRSEDAAHAQTRPGHLHLSLSVQRCPDDFGSLVEEAPGNVSVSTHRYAFSTTAHGSVRGHGYFIGDHVLLQESSGTIDHPARVLHEVGMAMGRALNSEGTPSGDYSYENPLENGAWLSHNYNWTGKPQHPSGILLEELSGKATLHIAHDHYMHREAAAITARSVLAEATMHVKRRSSNEEKDGELEDAIELPSCSDHNALVQFGLARSRESLKEMQTRSGTGTGADFLESLLQLVAVASPFVYLINTVADQEDSAFQIALKVGRLFTEEDKKSLAKKDQGQELLKKKVKEIALDVVSRFPMSWVNSVAKFGAWIMKVFSKMGEFITQMIPGAIQEQADALVGPALEKVNKFAGEARQAVTDTAIDVATDVAQLAQDLAAALQEFAATLTTLLAGGKDKKGGFALAQTKLGKDCRWRALWSLEAEVEEQ
eukprot:TRINITY_DN113243_c0_g1_i1.p1 TRINITY_DN113243_c0_g1~~TRINITY_DN113243_c0_g1_i1.p1  ORF type:complete len:473 (+),score=90.12 TRINITY_DN113243_c0_g1_i1:161-1579(+)